MKVIVNKVSDYGTVVKVDSSPFKGESAEYFSQTEFWPATEIHVTPETKYQAGRIEVQTTSWGAKSPEDLEKVIRLYTAAAMIVDTLLYLQVETGGWTEATLTKALRTAGWDAVDQFAEFRKEVEA